MKRKITYLRKKWKEEEIFNILDDDIKKWFKKKYKHFTPPQTYSIMNIHKNNNILISSPTGSGKTLSAFLSILNELFILSKKGKLENKIYAVYVSPLKALANDVKRNLLEPLREIEEVSSVKHGIRVAIRNSDTTAYEKSKMVKKPPHILITTPESFVNALAASKFKENLKGIKWFIVDEIHSLAENKRGALLSLGIERLAYFNKFVRIGLSATVSPLDEVAKFLVGKEKCKIVDVQEIKEKTLEVITPVKDMINNDFETIHNAMYKKIHELIQKHKTTLIFTNTRSATERVVNTLKTKYGYTDDEIGAHHSSLSKEIRKNIEERMKQGKLKVVVSSTSLELGIDIGSIDLVILLSSPKSIARALQRIGRSGHRLDEVSKGIFIAMDYDDLVECSIIRKCGIEKKIDKIKIPKNPLDVLIQHIVSMAYDELSVDTAYNIITSCYNFFDLSKEDFIEVLKYLEGKYTELDVKNVYGKIKIEDNKILPRKGSRMIFFLNSGVIPDTANVKVVLNKSVIGTIDELFLESLKKNDIFVHGGRTYRFLRSKNMRAYVESAVGLKPTVPSWFSESLPLSFDLALEIQKFRRIVEKAISQGNSLDVIKEYLDVNNDVATAINFYFNQQHDYIGIPHDRKMIIEIVKNKDYDIVFHSLFGRKVNDVLSRVFAKIFSNYVNEDFRISISDNNFVVTSSSIQDIYFAYQDFLNSDLESIANEIIENTEIFFRRFRQVSARSFLVLKRYKGYKKSLSKQQISSKQIYNIIKKVNPNFVVIKETKREILEDAMDLEHAKEAQKILRQADVLFKEVTIPSPFAMNIIMQGYNDILRATDKQEFVRKMYELISESKSNKTQIH